MKQSIQNGVKMLRHLGSVYKWSLVEIGRQAGREMDSRSIRRSIEPAMENGRHQDGRELRVIRPF